MEIATPCATIVHLGLVEELVECIGEKRANALIAQRNPQTIEEISYAAMDILYILCAMRAKPDCKIGVKVWDTWEGTEIVSSSMEALDFLKSLK